MKSFRDFLVELKAKNMLIELQKQASLQLELASVAKELDGNAIQTSKIKELPGTRVAANVFCTRELICGYFGIKRNELVPKLIDAIQNPTAPKKAHNAPVLEVTEKEVDLSKLPIPFHAPKDGGEYLSSAVVIANDKEFGRNCSFHRMMVIGKDKVSMRILHRHLDEYIKRAGGDLPVAVVVGVSANVLLAGATSIEIGKDELQIANSLMPLNTVKLGNGIEVPADAEYSFEGIITNEQADEGPFVDLTGTYDIKRKQRVMKITKVHHRKNPIWHLLVPGGLEHKMLMGMPREPTIYREVNKVAKCTGVNITSGGCSWLHAVVGIKKQKQDDGKKAIEAAFAGHKSLKRVIVVDNDIDIYDPDSVEWALATRFQADKCMVLKKGVKGSSLDPSADPHTYKTTKLGLDATKPLGKSGAFDKAQWKKVNAQSYR